MTILTAQDEEHLRLLAMFHNVVAGLGVLFSLFPLLHLGMGLMLVTGTFDIGEQPKGFQPAFMGWFFIAFSLAWIIAGLTTSVCIFLAGRHLRRRERHMFCVVTAGVMCAFAPFGTVLGVFTLLVLHRPAVKAAFAASEAAEATQAQAR
jgi:ABC-type branched-subunit amino acid transport system permease subunit